MSVKLHIAENLDLPVDVVTQAIAILGIRRSGKSYTVRRFAEQFIKAKQQVVIIDPKGDWWGIRSSSDGKSPGLPITILGGEHGDIPLEVGAGELIAKLVVERNVSLLLDLSQFRKHEVAEFMGGKFGSRQQGFLEALYRLKAVEQYRTPLGLIIDEADAIAPQKPYKGEERMLGAAEDIVRRGGQRGIGCMMATQRAAVLNKNVLTQCPFLVQLRTSGSQDITALDDWIAKHGNPEARRVVLDEIASMVTGDAWFWWPEAGIFQRSHVLPIETFDSGATPKVGQKRIEPKQLAQVDLAALQERMADTIERAKADDPRTLRARIAELERALSKKMPAAKPQPDQAAMERAVSAAIAKTGQEAQRLHAKSMGNVRRAMENAVVGMRKQSELLLATAAHLEEAFPPVNGSIQFAATAMEMAPRAPVAQRAVSSRVEPSQPKPAVHQRVQSRASGSESNGRLQPAAQRILDALAWLESIRLSQASRNIVAFLASASPKSSAFMNNLGALRSAGLIDYPTPGDISLTENGRSAAAAQDVPLTSEELHARIYEKLPPAQRRILEAVIRHRHGSLSREELADQAGASPASSAFMNNLGALRSLGLIDYPRSGQVQAKDVLFIEGRSHA